jgi:hypothetical protein
VQESCGPAPEIAPAGQALHVTSADTSAKNPSEHTEHVDAPGVDTARPGSHAVHVSAPVAAAT